MKKSSLHELIHSLNGNERRYIKLNATYGSNRKCRQLFEILERQKEYNDEAVKKAFKNDYGKQLSRLKNYLAELILKLMRQYHGERTPKHVVKGLILDAEFLYQKRLFKQSYKVLSKAKSHAINYEFGTELLDALLLEMIMSLDRQDFDGVENCIVQFEKTLKELSTEIDFERLHLESYKLESTDSSIRHEDRAKQVDKLLSNQLLNSISSAPTFKTKLRFVNISSRLYTVSGNKKERYKISKMALQLFEDHPQHIKRNPRAYISSGLINCLIAAYYMNKFDEALEVSEKLKKLKNDPLFKNQLIQSYIFQYTTVFELSIRCFLGEFTKAIPLLKELEKGIINYEKFIPGTNLPVLYFNIAYAYFGLGEFSKTLHWLNKLYGPEINKHLRKDVQSVGRFLSLITHFEVNNEEYLQYAIKSTYYYLVKQKRLFPFEKAMIKFLRSLQKVNTDDELILEFIKVKNELEELTLQNEYDPTAFQYNAILIWLQSRIEKRPFTEVAKQVGEDEIQKSR